MPAYRRKAVWVTSSGAMSSASATSPMASVARAISMAEAPTAAPSCTWMRSSSVSDTTNRARRASARISPLITHSANQPATISTAMTESLSHTCWSMRARCARGRKAMATNATASSREAIPATPAGRPAARCGSAPTIIPTAVTATTCSAGWSAGCGPIRTASA